jgi:hypothetical protein
MLRSAVHEESEAPDHETLSGIVLVRTFSITHDAHTSSVDQLAQSGAVTGHLQSLILRANG